ncbi:MAG: glycosyltransferase [Ignavibacteriales bacterium]|nr:MAG: glycosyltransferase [Ignavibacteriales bacterium]
MKQKKILILSPLSIFPKIMASQERTYRIAERLSKDHIVDIAAIIRNENELKESNEKLKSVCNKFYPVHAVNPSNNNFKRKLYGIKFLISNKLKKIPEDYFYSTQKPYIKFLADIIAANKYDVVHAEYWFMAEVFRHIDPYTFKVIDTVDVLFDKKRQSFENHFGKNIPASKQKELQKYKSMELENLELADLLISISEVDNDVFKEYKITGKKIVIPIGQPVDYFSDYTKSDDGKTILFYGSMGGHENIDAFFRFWNEIYPAVKEKVPDVKINIVGANPPDSIKVLTKNKNVSVTGFVQDVRPHLAKSSLLMVPLNVAAGFRGRVVDVMAMSIPVVGTPKALNCVGISNGVEGFISDSNKDLAHNTVQLLTDSSMRTKMGNAALQFVKDHLSVEATYGKLSEYYGNIEIK